MKLKVNTIRCKSCGDTLFSRARHDFRECSCGQCFVDGGFDYFRCGCKNDGVETIELEIEASKDELYWDWSKGNDKFGLMKGK